MGDHTLVFSGYVNGSLAESQILAAYINQRRRINWALVAGQEPYFYREASELRQDPNPATARDTLITNVRRLVLRTASAEAYFPLNRFRRVEAGLQLANVSDDRLSLVEPFDGNTGNRIDNPRIRTTDLGSSNYIQPSVAMVFDNSLMGYVGPFYGRRYRLSIAQSMGTWNFTTATVDYRRYDQLPGPFVLATRGLYFGRIGRNANQFRVFLGNPDLLRGHTSGSYFRNECRTANANDATSETGCSALDQLIGTQVAVATAEIRFPVLNSSIFHWLPLGFPPVDGAVFYDVGLAWNGSSVVKLTGSHDNPSFRTPLQTWGVSLRTNLFNFVILRLDYSIPRDPPGVNGLWAISLGPTF